MISRQIDMCWYMKTNNSLTASVKIVHSHEQCQNSAIRFVSWPSVLYWENIFFNTFRVVLAIISELIMGQVHTHIFPNYCLLLNECNGHEGREWQKVWSDI